MIIVTTFSSQDILHSAIKTITAERDGLNALNEAFSGALGLTFIDAVQQLAATKGRIVVTGMGKSGHVGRKVAATFASTGTASFYVHPGEASHGDLGMITRDDVILALSWSGEAPELTDIISYAKRFKILLIAVTSNAHSLLGSQASLCLTLPKAKEACPIGLAPTTSTTMQLALCDAFAVALLERRGFSAEDFKIFHPGGKLGAQLRLAKDIMHTGDHVPLVFVGSKMDAVIREIGKKNFGCAVVKHSDGTLAGIVTDGDLRRNLTPNLPNMLVEEIMTKSPKTVSPNMLLAELLDIQETSKITTLIVVEDNQPVGLIHYLDILRAGVA